MNEKPIRKRSAKRVVLTVLLILLALILLAGACVMIYLNHMLNKIPRVDPELEYTLSPSEADAFLGDDPELVTMAPGSTEDYVKLEDLTFPPSVLLPTVPTQPATQPPETEPATTAPPATEPEATAPMGTEPEPTAPATQPPTTPPTTPATQPPATPSVSDVYGDHLVNILLVGQDRKGGTARQRSDTMILVSLNKSDGIITLTSFMRDQYVQIPGYKPNKLNAAYAFGGMRLLSKTLELNYGVQIHGVVEVDLSGFEKIIDLLGGVDVTLTQAEADYFNRKHYGVTVGVNHFTGRMALSYVRVRSIDSDYGRANRQRKLIAGMIESYKNLPLDEMLNLVNEVLPLVSTNLSNAQILSYAMEFFPMLATAQIKTLRIPVDGTFVGGLVQVREGFYGWFQYNIDFEANKKILWEIFRNKN